MLTKDNTQKVLEIFLIHPEQKFHLRELARLTKLSVPGVRKIVGKLAKEDLVQVSKEKLVTNVSASRNEKFIAFKRAYNLYTLYTSGLLTFLKEQYEEPGAIVLFGSYSRGEDISTSDIDIAVVTRQSRSPDLAAFEKKLARSIKLHEVQLSKAESEFLNTLANGIILYGYLGVA
ncbi:nucleotidyltransferase domain-containing protein [Candidatus Woesearchaeota archaeon]|nr:nucleotidyltransferase domain-containing protein [Candidatus Woesearchaeota archaeon]